MNRYLLIIIVLLCMPLVGFAKKKPTALANFDRQVKIHLGDYDSLCFSSEGELVIECYRDSQKADLYYSSMAITIRRQNKGLAIGDDNGIFSSGLITVVLKPRFPNIFINSANRRYRGFIICKADTSLIFNPSQKITVFNQLDIEDYLKGVLPGEMGHREENELEALKAQAIAARTYAISRLVGENPADHLKNTIEDQLYLGAGAEIPLHNKAVEATIGLIMTYRNQPIAAYYFAVCGGSTQSREKAWGGEKVSYLKSIDDDSFCAWPKSYNWKETFTSEELNNNLSQYFAGQGHLPPKGFGKILNLLFKEDKSTGRISEMKVETTTDVYKVNGDKIRWALRRPSMPGAILPSTKFAAKIIIEGGTIVSLELSGAGNGHGVGMCQCGAIGRARAGATYEQILNAYYKSISIKKLY